MKNKRLLIMVFFGFALLKTGTAAALNLSQEFGNLASDASGTSSTINPQQFRAGAMRGHHFGAASIRLPVKKIDLVSVQRASINAGCHGVDINFGGMSFISASEIVTQLKTIAKGAPALIYTMTLNAIAAPLVNALNGLYDTMANLSSSLKNSCEASMALIQGVEAMVAKKSPGLGVFVDDMKEAASNWASMDIPAGVKSLSVFSKDEGSAVSANEEASNAECLMTALSLGLIKGADSQEACGRNKAKPVMQEADEMVAKLKVGNDENGAKAVIKAKFNNTTWNALQILGVAPNAVDSAAATTAFFPDYRLAVLFQSLIGTTIVKEDANDAKQTDPVHIPASIKADTFVSVLMCGTVNNVKNYTPPAGSSADAYKWAIEWCKIKYGIKDDGSTQNMAKVINCPNQSASKAWMEGCKDAKEELITTFEDNYMNPTERSDKGMLFSTIELLNSAVDKAARADSEFSPEERALIAMAPFPLYEIINVAASTPSLAKALIQKNATVLAFHFSSATINSLYDSIAKADGLVGGRMGLVPVAIKDEFFNVQSELQAASAKEVQKLSLYSNTTDIIMHQVKTINGEVLKSTMAMGINGADFADAMSTMLSN